LLRKVIRRAVHGRERHRHEFAVGRGIKFDRQPLAAGVDVVFHALNAYCKPENKVSLGFVEGLNNKIRVIQHRAYGLRDEEYLRLKILTCMLSDLK
jgi:hypothetical protein